MSPDERDPEEVEETRLHGGDFDDDDFEDTVREIPAGEPPNEDTFENRSVEDTLVQAEGTPTRSTRGNAPAGTRPTWSEPSPTGQTEPATREDRRSRRGGERDDIQPTKTEILGEKAEVFAGRFEVLKTIGQGGMGRVYAVRDRQIEGRKIALKILLPKFSKNESFRQLFFDEIRANQKFVSEYVVQIRDTGQAQDGHLFLTMDMVDGISLGALIKREGGLQARHGLEIARQVLLGLAPGHEKGIIHRDIKPSNVMLVARTTKTEDNPFGVAVRLLDFGIAAIASDLTPGQIIGTPQYMSPEQLEGERLDQRTDLFSVGVLLYEMISGKRPFGGTTLQEISRALRETQIPDLVRDLEGLPKPVQKVLHKALQKDREKRYQSAAEFIEAIQGSSAFKEPTRIPAWSSMLLVLMTGVAAYEGYVITKLESQSITNESLRDARQTQDQRIAALEAENLQLRSQLDSKTTEKIDTGDQGNRIALLETQFGQAEAAAKEAKDDLNLLKLQMQTKDDQIVQLDKENRRLQEEVSRVSAVRQDDAKLAMCFDGLMVRLEGLQWNVIPDYFQRQQDELNVFVKRGEDGYALVAALAGVAAGLAAEDPGTARAALAIATDEGTRRAFEIECTDWIGSVLADLERDPAEVALMRKARLDAVIGLLEDEIEVLEQQLIDEREQADQALTELPVDADPQQVIALYERHGDLDLEPFLARFAEHATERIVRGGRFDKVAAIELRRLDDWSRWLAADGRGQKGDGAQTIRELRAAQGWYEDGTVPPRSMFRTTEIRAGDRDWRTLLALQLTLAAEGAGWPLESNDQAVYRQRFVKADAVAWIDEKLTSKSAGSWSIARVFHQWDPTGRQLKLPHEDVVTRDGDVFLGQGGIEIVDLRSTNGSLRVEFWSPKLGPFEEKPHTFTKGLDLAGFAARVRGESIPCLVARQTGIETWLSPRYGLVREIRDGVHERELMFTANPR